MRVIVIGAGLGGLTLAHGLRRAGIDVVVYERDGPQGRPQGISLHFDDRGASALRTCLPPEHFAMADATMGGKRDHSQQMAEVGGKFTIVGTQELDGKQPRPRPGRSANRPLLRAVLLDGLEEVVQFGAECTGFEQRADGMVEARFADGSSDVGDVLVGADGVGSRIRRDYLPRVRILDSGIRMLMGATPLRAISDTALLEMVGDNPTAVQVDGKVLMALSILRYQEPPVAARDQWMPKLRSSAVTAAEDYVMWAMPISKARVGAAQLPADVWSVARARAADAHPTLRSIIEDAWSEVTFPHRVGFIRPMRAWRTSPVTVIGDAIHVAPGAGGNLAMQDAKRLRDALVPAALGEQDVRTAIRTYEDAMRGDNFPKPLTLQWFRRRYLLRLVLPLAQRKVR